MALTYTPVATHWPQGAGTVTVVRFNDARENPNLVGEVRNGLGMKTAKVLLADNQDAGGWVANALAQELQNAGFTVSKIVDPAQAGQGAVITGSIAELYTSMYMSYRANARITIVVLRAGVPVLNKEYLGKAKAGAGWVNTEEYQKVMQAALQDAMTQAVPEIAEKLR